MPDAQPHQRLHYWELHTDGAGSWHGRYPNGPPGEDLAALRRGIDREPGTVPAMWRFYTTLTEDGRISRALRAEHVALTLFGVHQQSQRSPVHRSGIRVGSAIHALRHSGAFSSEAVDRRFAAAATARSLGELAVHLRGLVSQLRGVQQGLDYDILLRDLRSWQYPDGLRNTQRHWGAQYFTPREKGGGDDSASIGESGPDLPAQMLASPSTIPEPKEFA